MVFKIYPNLINVQWKKNPATWFCHWILISVASLVLSTDVHAAIFINSQENVYRKVDKFPETDDETSKPAKINVTGEIIWEAENPFRQDVFSIFPNPAGQVLFIRPEHVADGPVELEIFDVTGRMIYSSLFSQGMDDRIAIQLETYQPGYYFLRIKAEKKYQTFRFIKQ